MAGVFNDLIFLGGPGMLGDEIVFVIKGDPLVIGLEGQHPGGIGKGDTVAIGFKLNEKLGGTLDSQDEAGIIIGFGERDELGFLLLVKKVDGSFAGSAVDSAIRHLVSPEESVMVEIGQGQEGPG
jgi:hypothetical protein